ncbi:hypothetical protein GCM10022419_069460 [Nonomuraea rosea]|uniref:Uncharacterized protein n=1 Tax=Nonomuraea rosea TaxID=638574 RepID=A0ABP6Y7X3_9ACTN
MSFVCVSGEWFKDMGTSADKGPLLDTATPESEWQPPNQASFCDGG